MKYILQVFSGFWNAAVVTAEDVMKKTDPGYIQESLEAIREHGFEGAALCWNVLQAPEEHINAISR